MSELTATLDEIEVQLDDGVYQPGPWAAFLRAANARSRDERAALAEQVSRVSDKLHRRNHAWTLPLWAGLLLEGVATAIAIALLGSGLQSESAGQVLAAAIILTVTLQPLVKIATGTLLGVRYSYFYIWGRYEPRFKMRYGTYLCTERWQRVVLHLSGTIGSPLAFWWVAMRAENVVPGAAAICELLFWLLVVVQVAAFSLVMSGSRRLARVGWVTSGGAAARELRSSGPR